MNTALFFKKVDPSVKVNEAQAIMQSKAGLSKNKVKRGGKAIC